MTASLAYRKNEAQILSGIVPEKYLRIIPHIPGDKILEIGSAEGVLALCLAKRGKQVTALEKNADRHQSAIALSKAWGVDGVTFVNGTVGHCPELIVEDDVETLVAVRMIYYLGETLDPVFSLASRHIPNVVLCGNRNRADRYRAGIIDPTSNADDYYASREGMRDVLERHGYVVIEEVTEGDEIVVGRKNLQS